jgi:hypothetical protein
MINFFFCYKKKESLNTRVVQLAHLLFQHRHPRFKFSPFIYQIKKKKKKKDRLMLVNSLSIESEKSYHCESLFCDVQFNCKGNDPLLFNLLIFSQIRDMWH